MNKIINNLVLGEEYISQITFDAIKEELRVNIRHIMRSGPNNCEWGFDEELAIDEGVLVFTGVEKIFFDPNGTLPNDIDDIKVEELSEAFKVTFHCYGFESKVSVPADFSVVAKEVYLIDTKNPDIKITE